MAGIIRTWFFLAMSLSGALIEAGGLERADYFIEAYGRVSVEDHETVAQANKVFQSLAWIAQNQISNVPRLIVVNSKDKPWAIALPDNSVILSMGAVRICSSLSVEEKIDACLAFVLGHELAHLSNRDFWHRDTYQALMGSGRISNEYSDREVELKADEIGYLYASLAGYRVSAIFNEQDNLFDLWASHAQSGETKNNIEIRTALIDQKTEELTSKLALADYALVLTSFNKFEDAIPLYKELIDLFPAKEFLNNIGYSYLRLAMRSMMPSDDEHFVFPALLETGNVMDKHSKVLKSINTAAYIHQLGNAVTYFEKALDVNKQYVPALYNLAISRFFLGQFHEARALIERAISLDPSNYGFQMVRSIVIYRQETDVDMWPLTVTRLEALAKKHPEDYLLKYNIAVMYQFRNLGGEARSIYSEIMSHSSDVELKVFACRKSNPIDSNCERVFDTSKASTQFPVLPESPGDEPSTKWVLGSSIYEFYSTKQERWLYINGKPALFSSDTHHPVFRNIEKRCFVPKNAESIFGKGIVFCGEDAIKLIFGKQNPNFWAVLSG